MESAGRPARATTLPERTSWRPPSGDVPARIEPCGGDFRPEEYAVEFRRFTSWVPDYGLKLRFIGSGPGANERDPQVSWTRGFLENLVAKSPRLA